MTSRADGAAEVVPTSHSLHAPKPFPGEAPMVDHDAVAPEALYQHGSHGPQNMYPYDQQPGTQEKERTMIPVQHEPPRSRKICGLRPVTFWLSLALAVVVIAGAVGGGVGGSLAGRDRRGSESGDAARSTGSHSASVSSTNSVASYAPAPSSSSASRSVSGTSSSSTSYVTSGETGIAALSCSEDDPYTTPSGTRFDQHCYVNWPVGRAGLHDLVQDISDVITYTLQDCMNRCDDYNAGDTTPVCNAVTYAQNLTALVLRNGGNCVLKTTNGVVDVPAVRMASAVRLR